MTEPQFTRIPEADLVRSYPLTYICGICGALIAAYDMKDYLADLAGRGDGETVKRVNDAGDAHRKVHRNDPEGYKPPERTKLPAKRAAKPTKDERPVYKDEGVKLDEGELNDAITSATREAE